MGSVLFHNVDVGSELPAVQLPPLTRTALALYAGASGDHMELHIDTDIARKAGMPDVFGHGMLSAAWLARAVTQWVPQQQIRSLNFRFTGITHLYNEIKCGGRVVSKFEQDGQKLVQVALESANQYGEVKVIGAAILALQ